MRARELGIILGDLEAGPSDAIGDFGGVGVGQTTLIHGDDALGAEPHSSTPSSTPSRKRS